MVMGFFQKFFGAAIVDPPKSPIETAEQLNEQANGSTGSEIYSGYFDEEYLTKLLASEGIKVYDQMRRSDGQVKMLLSVSKNPIKSASWSFVAADETDEEQEIADFCKHVIMDDIRSPTGKRKTFNDFLTEALTMIEFGFSVFEIVHKNVVGHPRFGDYLGLADLGFRHQRSILEWVLYSDGSINYVRQLAYGDLSRDVAIPGQFLMVLTNDKEGDNYEGISMLRPCYGSWFRKNVYRRMQAIGIERAAKGVPIGTVPMEAYNRTDLAAQITNFQNLLDQLSAHEKNGIVLGAGFDVKELKISHDSEKVQAVIDGENTEMTKSFMANFMELGMTSSGSGSYSLGSDLSDIFLSGIEHLAYQICEKINLQLVEPLVRAKYGDRDVYPKLTVKGINDKAGKELADSLTALLNAGGLQKSPRLQKHLHEVYNLPSIDEDIAAQEEERLKNPPEPVQQPRLFADQKKNCCAFKLSDEQRQKFPVSAFIEDRAALLADIMRRGLKTRSADMINQMTTVIAKGGDVNKVRKAVLAVGMPDAPDYIDALRQWAGSTVQDALAATLAELNKSRHQVKLDDVSKLPKTMRERIIQTVLLTAAAQDNDIEKAVWFAFNENYLTESDAPAVVEAISSARDKYFDKNLIDTSSVTMTSNVTNNVRNDVFSSDDVFEDIESFVFMNPAPVTAVCQSLVGTVFSKQEYETTEWLPPLHHNCKSYLEAQTTGAPGNRPITGSLTVTDPRLIKQASLV